MFTPAWFLTRVRSGMILLLPKGLHRKCRGTDVMANEACMCPSQMILPCAAGRKPRAVPNLPVDGCRPPVSQQHRQEGVRTGWVWLQGTKRTNSGQSQGGGTALCAGRLRCCSRKEELRLVRVRLTWAQILSVDELAWEESSLQWEREALPRDLKDRWISWLVTAWLGNLLFRVGENTKCSSFSCVWSFSALEFPDHWTGNLEFHEQ